MYNTHWLIIDIHESFLSLAILIIAQLSADNTVMDHAKEKNMEKLINNAPFALVLVFLVIGFILLIKGADFFVEGSSSVAKRLHVPSIIIGLTIVAMGTSLPETAVSVSASITGNNELAVSNVVGSNIFNLMVVIGVCAMIATVEVARETIRRDIPLSLICAGLLLLLGSIGLGDQTKSGSAFLVMAIVGNACLPQFTAYIMHCNEHIYYIAYIVPMICFAFCAYYGCKGYKIKS